MTENTYILKRLSLNLQEIENPYQYDNKKAIKKLIREINNIVNSKIVKFVFKKYKPQGYTGIAVIQDSSISINTYPEFAFMSIDVSTCGVNCKTLDVVKYIKENIKCKGNYTFMSTKINDSTAVTGGYI